MDISKCINKLVYLLFKSNVYVVKFSYNGKQIYETGIYRVGRNEVPRLMRGKTNENVPPFTWFR